MQWCHKQLRTVWAGFFNDTGRCTASNSSVTSCGVNLIQNCSLQHPTQHGLIHVLASHRWLYKTNTRTIRILIPVVALGKIYTQCAFLKNQRTMFLIKTKGVLLKYKVWNVVQQIKYHEVPERIIRRLERFWCYLTTYKQDVCMRIPL